MRLFEFDDPDPIITRLVAITDQLKSDIDDGKVGVDMTTDQLLNYFSQYDIVVDKSDLYNMIQKPPLKNLISNIEGDSIVFKGKESIGTTPPQGDHQKTVAQMANKAASKLK